MDLFPLINLFSSILCVYLGIFTLRLEPKARINRLSLMIFLCFAIWGFAFSFIHSSHSEEMIGIWYNISSIGWCMVSGFGIHFVLLLVRKDNILRNRWMYAAMYAPGILFTFKEFTGTLYATGFVWVGIGYSEVPIIHGIWLWLFILYQTGYFVLGIILLFFWGKRSRIRREKKQSGILVVTSTVSLALAFTSDILLPGANIYVLPALSPIFVLLWAFGIWYSITHYKMLSMNLAHASDEIVSRMKDLLMLLDLNGTIMKINPQVTALLGFDEKSLIGKPFYDLTSDKVLMEGEFLTMIVNNLYRIEIENGFITKSGGSVPMKISASMIRDNFGDPIGAVVIGNDLREKKQLQKEIQERAAAEEKLRRRNEVIEQDLLNAQIIQKALLPDSVPLSERLLTVFRYHPMDAIGGDYFSFTKFLTGELGIFICDVSGHGVSAALFLSLLKFEFDRICRIYGHRPKKFIETLNKELIVNMQHYFITAIYGLFSFDSQTEGAMFTFSNGGHLHPILFRAETGTAELLHCKGILIGKFDDARYNQVNVNLNKGDRLYLYTDGIIETQNSSNEYYGFSGIISQLEKMGNHSLSETVDAVINDVNEFRGPVPVEDDVVIIGFEIT